MVLAIDIGNTNIAAGIYKGSKLSRTLRLQTASAKTADGYAGDFACLFELYGYDRKMFTGAIISTVVPQLRGVMSNAVELFLGFKPLLVSELDTGLEIRTDFPKKHGDDLVCAEIAAIEKYPKPCIVFDLGTATTVGLISQDGAVLGGAIMPGVEISLRALVNCAAQLTAVELNAQKVGNAIGTNTDSCVNIGVIIGTACMIDSITVRYRELLGGTASVIMTGGISELILPHCREKIIHDKNLVLDGMFQLHSRFATVRQ